MYTQSDALETLREYWRWRKHRLTSSEQTHLSEEGEHITSKAVWHACRVLRNELASRRPLPSHASPLFRNTPPGIGADLKPFNCYSDTLT